MDSSSPLPKEGLGKRIALECLRFGSGRRHLGTVCLPRTGCALGLGTDGGKVAEAEALRRKVPLGVIPANGTFLISVHSTEVQIEQKEVHISRNHV